MRRGGTAIAVMLALAGAGCASAPGPGGKSVSLLPPPAETGSTACFVRRMVTSFTALDDTNLVVFAPSRSEAYHVRIWPPAAEMSAASAVAFTSRSNQVCGAAEDAVFFDEGRTAPRHAITAVSRLSEGALSWLVEQAAGIDQDRR